MANVMHSLETGQYVPDTGWYEMGLQAKLTIGLPGDKYEQEADRVARQVVQQINSPQKGNNEGEVKGKPQHEIQRKALTGGIKAPINLEGGIKEARGRGKPLSETIRHPLEQAMGADFSGVRVHTDARADQLNKSIQAKAFTTGQDVFFRQGEYQPGSRGGQELIAHELTHVRQQRSGRELFVNDIKKGGEKYKNGSGGYRVNFLQKNGNDSESGNESVEEASSDEMALLYLFFYETESWFKPTSAQIDEMVDNFVIKDIEGGYKKGTCHGYTIERRDERIDGTDFWKRWVSLKEKPKTLFCFDKSGELAHTGIILNTGEIRHTASLGVPLFTCGLRQFEDHNKQKYDYLKWPEDQEKIGNILMTKAEYHAVRQPFDDFILDIEADIPSWRQQQFSLDTDQEYVYAEQLINAYQDLKDSYKKLMEKASEDGDLERMKGIDKEAREKLKEDIRTTLSMQDKYSSLIKDE
ncbi:MAG: DUF4157 domain-containing protein [Moorea sp. SIO4A3]|nr:DUF4157 domain-containing protein [Moorena sp. SIO4A3]